MVLHCLHRVCGDCIEKITHFNGSLQCSECKDVTKAPKHGTKQSATLPAIENKAESEEGTPEAPQCDHCEEADSKCAEQHCEGCGDNFCKQHAETHRTSKKYTTRCVKNHTGLIELSEQAAKAASSSPPCPLHKRQALTHYCRLCLDLACQQCLDTGAHGDHKEDITSIENAAQEVREYLDESKHSASKVCREALHAYLKQVNDTIHDLQEQCNARSKEITKEFQCRMDAMKARRDKLLSEVNGLLFDRQEQLEEQVKRLSAGIQESDNLLSTPGLCITDCDLLRISPWLKDKAEFLQGAAKRDRKPCVECQMVFRTARCVSLEEIERMGIVYDSADVDPGKSLVTAPDTARIQSEYVVEIKLQNRVGEDVQLDSPIYTGLDVSLSKDPGAERSASSTPTSTGSSSSRATTPVASSFAAEAAAAAETSSELLSGPIPGGVLAKPVRHATDLQRWVCRPELFGSYIVTVKCGQFEIGGSPLHFRAVEAVTVNRTVPFDTTASDRALGFTDRNLTVTSQDSIQRSAYTAQLKAGCYYFRMKFATDTNIVSGDMFPAVGVVPENFTSHRGNFQADGKFTGLSAGKGAVDGQGTKETSCGTVVNWAKVSWITILLNCETRKLTMQCRQSDSSYSVTWSNIPKGVRIRAGLFSQGSQFKILPIS